MRMLSYLSEPTQQMQGWICFIVFHRTKSNHPALQGLTARHFFRPD